MSSLRPLLPRLALAMFGMLLLWLIVYVGLGLAVRSRAEWLKEFISTDRYEALDNAYARAVAGLFSGDSDGDGASDGLEWYDDTNPRDPLSHPRIYFDWNAEAPAVEVKWIPGHYRGMGERSPSHEVCFVVNQRGRLSGLARFVPHAVPFAPGFQLRFKVSPGWLCAAPGSALTDEDLILPVAPDGSFAIDLQPTQRDHDDTTLLAHSSLLSIEVASTREKTKAVGLYPIWPQSPITPAVVEWLPEPRSTENSSATVWDDSTWMPIYHLSWPTPPPVAQRVLVEARAPGTKSSWIPICLQEPNHTTCELATNTMKDWKPANGAWTMKDWKPASGARLEFRAIPFSYAPP